MYHIWPSVGQCFVLADSVSDSDMGYACFYALLVVTGVIFPFDFICMIARVVPGLRIGPRCSRTTGRKRRSNPG